MSTQPYPTIMGLRSSALEYLWAEAFAQANQIREGCDIALARRDQHLRNQIVPCEVCESMFHINDLEPCGIVDAACLACREAWEAMQAEEVPHDRP